MERASGVLPPAVLGFDLTLKVEANPSNSTSCTCLAAKAVYRQHNQPHFLAGKGFTDLNGLTVVAQVLFMRKSHSER